MSVSFSVSFLVFDGFSSQSTFLSLSLLSLPLSCSLFARSSNSRGTRSIHAISTSISRAPLRRESGSALLERGRERRSFHSDDDDGDVNRLIFYPSQVFSSSHLPLFRHLFSCLPALSSPWDRDTGQASTRSKSKNVDRTSSKALFQASNGLLIPLFKASKKKLDLDFLKQHY